LREDRLSRAQLSDEGDHDSGDRELAHPAPEGEHLFGGRNVDREHAAVLSRRTAPVKEA